VELVEDVPVAAAVPDEDAVAAAVAEGVTAAVVDADALAPADSVPVLVPVPVKVHVGEALALADVDALRLGERESEAATLREALTEAEPEGVVDGQKVCGTRKVCTVALAVRLKEASTALRASSSCSAVPTARQEQQSCRL
jgi:hypothetical protein